MKKLILAAIPAILLSCSGGYTISGTAPEGCDSVFLTISDTAKVVADTAVLGPDGKFSFSGKLTDISDATIRIKRGEERPLFSMFVLFNDNIVVKPDTAQRSGLSAEGSAYDAQVSAIMENVYRSESDDAPYFVIDSVVTADPKNPLVPYLMSNLVYYLSVQQFDSLNSKIDTSLKGNMYLTRIAPHIEILRKTDVGQPFTDFTCYAMDRSEFTLSSVAGKGRWLLVDFWASWCGPCRRENPNVVAAYNAYHDKGFDILGVSLDKSAEKWKEAVEKDSLTWMHVSDLNMWESPARIVYGIMSVPSNVMIAPDGTIAARNLRGEALGKFLSENLK